MGAREESVAYSVFGGEWVDSIGDLGARAGLVRVGWLREKARRRVPGMGEARSMWTDWERFACVQPAGKKK
jgi:hypothetical protein